MTWYFKKKQKQQFLSTPSARRATSYRCEYIHELIISIHALREEGDSITFSRRTEFYDFYPRPLRGGRLYLPVGLRPRKTISIHALCEEGDLRQAFQVQKYYISIHALCEEGDTVFRVWLTITKISIHALCEEGDHPPLLLLFGFMLFLSTPSARRATDPVTADPLPGLISIHALCEEGDVNFHRLVLLFVISIHALCEEGDPPGPRKRRGPTDFYPRPLRGGRRGGI